MNKQTLRRYQLLQIEAEQLDEIAARLIQKAPGRRTPEIERARRLYAERAAELAKQAEAIEDAIQALPDRERIILRAHYLMGDSWEAIAARLHYSTRQVHRIHARALQRIEEQAPCS